LLADQEVLYGRKEPTDGEDGADLGIISCVQKGCDRGAVSLVLPVKRDKRGIKTSLRVTRDFLRQKTKRECTVGGGLYDRTLAPKQNQGGGMS